jgi:hypothetical protein
MITAYNVKTKEKGVEMLKAVIDRNGNRCFAKGVSKSGDKLCAAIGLENAEKEIKAGNATKGTGW